VHQLLVERCEIWIAFCEAWMTTSMSVPTHLEQLSASLAQLPEGESLYALVDLANLAGDVPRALAMLKAHGAMNVLDDPRPDAALACPWLLGLTPDARGQKALAQTAQWATQSACCTWLRSDFTLPKLAHALKQRTEAELPDHYPIYLRVQDPRVLPELHRVLADDPQADRYWALGVQWLYLDRAQQLQSMRLLAGPSPNAFVPPLLLQQAQADALLAAAEVDRVMPELVREAPDAFLALPPAERLASTRRSLSLADELQLSTHADRVTLAILGLSLGPAFVEQTPWPEVLAQVKAGRMSLKQAIQKALQ
jgi:hypothetical protein